jgi:hypothetical protein
MAKVITTSLILVLLVVAIINDCNVEGAKRANQHEKDDHIYKSQKLDPGIDCLILYKKCLIFPYLWPLYYKLCASQDHTVITTTGAPKAEESLP